MAWNFPLARRGWRAGMRLRANWLRRHRHPFNFAVHLVGIPLGFLGLGLLLLVGALALLGVESPLPGWPWLLGVFVLGYVLQFVGHLVEGNDVGELIPLKRALGLRVVAEAGETSQPAAHTTSPDGSAPSPTPPQPPRS